jgi:hypothetical protein
LTSTSSWPASNQKIDTADSCQIPIYRWEYQMHPDYLFRRTEASSDKQTRRSAQHQVQDTWRTRSPSDNRSSVTQYTQTHTHTTDKATTSHKTTEQTSSLNMNGIVHGLDPAGQHFGGGGDVDIQPAAGLGGLPLSPSTGRRALDRTEDQMQHDAATMQQATVRISLARRQLMCDVSGRDGRSPNPPTHH